MYKTLNRKELAEKYGTWFSTETPAERLLERVSKQLVSCEKWTANLKELQNELRMEARKERATELKDLLQGMSPEELQTLLNGGGDGV